MRLMMNCNLSSKCCIKSCPRSNEQWMEPRKNVCMFSIPEIITNRDARTKELSRHRRALWLSRINDGNQVFNRSLDQDTSSLNVCDHHFVSGAPALLIDCNQRDWAPNLNLGYDLPETNRSKRSDSQKMQSSMSGEQPETQPTSSGGPISDSASRPSLKRKHQENSSLQPQCQVLNFQVLDSQEFSVKELPTIHHDNSPDIVIEESLDITDEEPGIMQEETNTVPSELVLLDEPAQDCLVSEDAQPELTPQHTINTVLIPKPNDYIKVIDIQDIFKRKTRPKIYKIVNPVPETNLNIDSNCKRSSPIPITNSYLNSRYKLTASIPKTNCNVDTNSKIGNPIPNTNSNLDPSNKMGHSISQTISNLESANDKGDSIPKTNSSVVSENSKTTTLNQNNQTENSNRDTLSNCFSVQCQLCKQSLSNFSSAILHKCPVSAAPLFTLPVSALTRDKHGNIKASECIVCKALFISDTALKNHVASDHSKMLNQLMSSTLQSLVSKKMVPLSNLLLHESSVISSTSDAQKMVPQSNLFPQQSSVILPTSSAQKMVPQSNIFSQQSSVILPTSSAQKMVPQSNLFPQQSSVILSTSSAQKMVPQSNLLPQQSSVILPTSDGPKMVPQSNLLPQHSSVILPTSSSQKMVTQSNLFPQQSSVILPIPIAQTMPKPTVVSQTLPRQSLLNPPATVNNTTPHSNVITQFLSQQQFCISPLSATQKMAPNLVPQPLPGQPYLISTFPSQNMVPNSVPQPLPGQPYLISPQNMVPNSVPRPLPGQPYLISPQNIVPNSVPQHLPKQPYLISPQNMVPNSVPQPLMPGQPFFISPQNTVLNSVLQPLPGQSYLISPQKMVPNSVSQLLPGQSYMISPSQNMMSNSVPQPLPGQLYLNSPSQKMVSQSNQVPQGQPSMLSPSFSQNTVPPSNHVPQSGQPILKSPSIFQKMVPHSNIVPQSISEPLMVSPTCVAQKTVPQTNLVCQSQVEQPEIVPLGSDIDQEMVTQSNLIPECVANKIVTELEHRTGNQTNGSVIICPQTEIKLETTDSSQECNFVGMIPKIPEAQEQIAKIKVECTETRLRSFVPFEMSDPETFPTFAHQKFYRHFCKYHLKLEDTQTIRATITIPHLVQNVKPITNVLGLYQCQQCGMMYKNIGDYEMHLYKIHQISESNVECKICPFRTAFQFNLIMDHLRKHKDHYIHLVSQEEMYRCFKCENLSKKCMTLGGIDVVFRFKNLIITRKLVTYYAEVPTLVHFKYKIDTTLPEYPHKRSLYSCICSESFESQFEVDQHLECHVDYAFRKCSSCDERCDNMNVYYDHIDKMHTSSLLLDVDFRNKKEQLFFKYNDFACRSKNCSAKLINSCSLQLHARQNHKSLTKPNKTRAISTLVNHEKLQCTICDVGFFDLKLFYAHCVPYSPLLPSLLHECPKCVLRFSSDEESKAHLDEIHKGSDSFWCRVCNVPQYSSEKLSSHVQNDHNVSMFYCILCKTNFFSKKVAILHLKTCYSVEASGKDFICPICGLICDDFDFLINHVRIDFDLFLPKHQCKFCLNFFYGKLNLACHMLDAKCKHCGLYFCNAENLLEHIGIVHAR